MKKDPLIFIEHILSSIRNIKSFMENVTKSSLSKNIEKQSVVIRQIEVIGEASRNLPLSFTKKHVSLVMNEERPNKMDIWT